MKFVKMHGAGNDYIFIDCFGSDVDDMSRLAIEMSNRHFGVGGDGVVYLYPSMVADVKMHMFNADGSEGAMCGNAVRCIGKLVCDKYNTSEITVETKSGIKCVKRNSLDMFTVDMGRPEVSDINKPIDICGQRFYCTCVSMGNPHCVIFTDDVENVNMAIGEALQTHPAFSGGVNVEFIQGEGVNLKMRVYERGSGETLACGTGACAAVAASIMCGKSPMDTDITVSLRGGDLKVKLNGNIYLTGNAVKVYEGDYYDKVHFCDRRSCQRSR